MKLLFAIKNYDFSHENHFKMDTRLFFYFFDEKETINFFLERNQYDNCKLSFYTSYNQPISFDDYINKKNNNFKIIDINVFLEDEKYNNPELKYELIEFNNKDDLLEKLKIVINNNLETLNNDFDLFCKKEYLNNPSKQNYTNLNNQLMKNLELEINKMFNNEEPYLILMKRFTSKILNEKILGKITLLKKDYKKI